MFDWWQRLRRRREERLLRERAIPETLWRLTLARYPFLSRHSAEDQDRLRRLATLFLDRKEFTGAGGFVVTDDDGVVHHYDEILTGEAMEGGPVTLSWHDVATAGESAELGYNVVIHEFVHKIDMQDGAADGVPPLPSRAARDAWLATLEGAFERFCAQVDADVDTFLDPYGAEDIDEFFAVAAEAFFVAPREFARHHPDLHRLFRDYFRQDPARD
jgi:Mlc titration factor MtfA (ptsG expression regulator)